jgi:hypothetical protein
MVADDRAAEHGAIRTQEATMNHPLHSLPARRAGLFASTLSATPAVALPAAFKPSPAALPPGSRVGAPARPPEPLPLPLPDEGPTAFLGWFDSSRELRDGLHVIEHAAPIGGLGPWLR